MAGDPGRRIVWAARHPWLVVVLWVAVAIAAFPLAATVTKHLEAENLSVSGSPSVWADQQLSKIAAPPQAGPELLGGLPVAQLERAASAAKIPASWLHPSGGGLLVLPPGGTPAAALATLVQHVQQAGGSVRGVGSGAIGHEISSDAEHTLHSSSALALPLLLLLLPVVFGAAAQAVLPLIVAAVGAELALALVSLLEVHITLSVYLTDIVAFLALGVGVDYALFLTTRFREALDRGLGPSEAVGESLATAGRSVLFSGLAVTLAVATLLLAGTAYWRGLALGGAVAVISVLLATQTLLPALLRLMGPRVRWGLVPVAMERWSLWDRLAGWSTWRPAFSVVVGIALLALPAVWALQLHVTVPADLASMLPPSSPLRQASRLRQSLEGPGSIAPLPVALELSTTVRDPATWTLVSRVVQDVAALPGVARVSSPFAAGASPQQLAAALGGGSPQLGPLANFVNPKADPHLVVLAVVSASGPDQPGTKALLSGIQQVLARDLGPGDRGAVGGAVALLHDFNQHTSRRLPLVLGSAAVVALVVLWVATGSLVQALLGVLLDALVAAATAGILVLTIQHGGLGLEAQDPNLTVTPLVFVLLFGLSMDYEVILLHRIQEALGRGMPMRQAARHGIAETGGMITGAGLVMVVVFVVLLTSPLGVLKTLAIGMTAAILLDTWVVRTFLIPGLTALLGRWAFWPWRGIHARHQASP